MVASPARRQDGNIRCKRPDAATGTANAASAIQAARPSAALNGRQTFSQNVKVTKNHSNNRIEKQKNKK